MWAMVKTMVWALYKYREKRPKSKRMLALLWEMVIGLVWALYMFRR